MSRPLGTPEELERRRQQAVRAVADGVPRTTVAQVLGVHVKTVARWVRAGRTSAGVTAKRPPQRSPGLTDADLRGLERLLLQGAKAHGWANELWTAARVTRVIERYFRVTYHPEHVRKILKQRLGWTSQKPRRVARERDDKEVARWVDDEFPRIVRDAYRREAHLVFLDESGFFLTPTLRRTLAPQGQTPVLPAWDRHDRLSAISAITVSPHAARPNLEFEIYPHTIRGEQVVAFLADLHRRFGPLSVVWDRGPIHDKAHVVRSWLARHPGVVTEKFPGYVPDLNPDEGVWGWTKYGRLANLAAEDGNVLWDHLIDELVTLKFQHKRLQGFLEQTNLPGLTLAG